MASSEPLLENVPEKLVKGNEALCYGKLWWGTSVVPALAYNEDQRVRCEVLFQQDDQHFYNWADRTQVVTRESAPSAWYYAFLSNVLLWTFWAVFPIGVYAASSCGPGFASSPSWILATYLPVLALALFWEVKATAVTLPVSVSFLGPATIAGQTVTFKVWYGFFLGISFAAHGDFGTSGIFVGRLLKTATCSERRVDEVWHIVVSKSMLHFLPSLSTLGLVTWVLMLSQLALALGNGVPFKKRDNASGYWMGWSVPELLRRPKPVSPYFTSHDMHTKLGGHTDSFEATAALAESARMNLYLSRDFSFTLLKFRDGEVLQHAWARLDWISMMQRFALRIACYFVIESSLLSNLQASMLAVDKSIGISTDGLTILSIILSLTMAFYNLTMACIKMWKMATSIKPYLRMEVNGEELARCVNGYVVEKVVRRFYTIIIICVTSVLLATFLNVYALAKTIMATFVCEKGVWNLAGCVL